MMENLQNVRLLMTPETQKSHDCHIVADITPLN
jgi:hypothetical protein